MKLPSCLGVAGGLFLVGAFLAPVDTAVQGGCVVATIMTWFAALYSFILRR